MDAVGTAEDPQELPVAEGPPGHSRSISVLRPKPTLPSSDAAPIASHTSAFQRPAAGSGDAVGVPSRQSPHPRGGAGGSSSEAPFIELLQTTSEDELAATTVGSLQHSRGPGPSQLYRQRSRDSNDGNDELSRPSPSPALQASQQAMLQQQVRCFILAVVACGFALHLILHWADQMAHVQKELPLPF